MIKSYGKAITLLTALTASAQLLAFSNLIVFGDSLSDNGNFPESPTPFIKRNAPKVVSNTSTSFYVPFSNPVDRSNGNATPPALNIKETFAWPDLTNSLLAPQVPIEQDDSSKARSYRSISWTELLLAYAKQKNQTNSPFIIPSYLLMHQKIPNDSSVNYAWGSAMGAAGCYNRYYTPFKSCDRNSVITTRQAYMLDPTYDNRTKINVPGLPKQVDFFLQDQQAGRVTVDKHTLYTFWIGGNNLVDAYNHLLKGNPGRVLDFILGEPTASTLTAINKMANKLPADKRPKQVYIFTLMNPGLTPGYYHSNVATLAKVLSFSYNSWTALRIDFHNMFSKVQVKLIPIHRWYHDASHSGYFEAQMGNSCQVKGGDYSQAQTIPSTNCKGFMYWNDVHPAVDMQKITAYLFLKTLMTGHD
ncbi:MAG: SGNH/GDSL hydrolase family protein [Coxiellaceae bacterium]|nr:SGNH/GDSL hydrolase family protein [Coxiellaceae bacterium]